VWAISEWLFDIVRDYTTAFLEFFVILTPLGFVFPLFLKALKKHFFYGGFMKCTLSLLIAMLVFLQACTGLSKKEVKPEYGFFDDDSYRIAGVGIADPKLQGKEERRESSLHAAELYARYSIIEKFRGSCIESCVNPPKGWDESQKKKKAWLSLIENEIKKKGGRVIKSTWDKNDKCTILYEFRKKGLKKEVITCGGVFTY